MNHICIINNIICLCTEHLVRAQHSRYDLLCWRQIISIISQLRGRCGEIQTNWNSFQPQFDGFQNRLKNNYEWCDKKYMKRCVRCRSMPFGSLLYKLCILLFCISFFFIKENATLSRLECRWVSAEELPIKRLNGFTIAFDDWRVPSRLHLCSGDIDWLWRGLWEWAIAALNRIHFFSFKLCEGAAMVIGYHCI